MSTDLFSRREWQRTHEPRDREHGILQLTRCANGVGKGTRLELYASTHDDCPVEIHTAAEALELGRALIEWAARSAPPAADVPDDLVDLARWRQLGTRVDQIATGVLALLELAEIVKAGDVASSRDHSPPAPAGV